MAGLNTSDPASAAATPVTVLLLLRQPASAALRRNRPPHMTSSSCFTSTDDSSSSFPLDSTPPLGQRQRLRRFVLYFCLCLVANCPSRLFNPAEASSASAVTTPALILHPGCTNSSFALPPPPLLPLLLLHRRLVVFGGGSDETSSPLLPLRRQLLAALLPLCRPRNSTLWLLLPPPLMLLIASTFFLIFSHSPECSTFKHSYIRGRSSVPPLATTLTACLALPGLARLPGSFNLRRNYTPPICYILR